MFNSTNFIAPYISTDKRLILRDSNLNKVGGVNVCQYQKVTTEGTLVWVNLSDLKIILEFSTVADAKQAVLNLELAIEALRPNCEIASGLSVVTHDGSLTGAGTVLSPLSVVGGGESLLTYAQAQTALGAGTLIAGAHYKITDRCDAGMIFLATTTNQFDTNGVGGFLNADFQARGTQSVHMIGQWYATMPTPAVGQISIYNDFSHGSRHYRNLTGAVGTAPSGDAVNWVLLPKSVANGYIEEWDFIIYDFVNDYLDQRLDTRGNNISDSAFQGTGGLNIFQWGFDNVTSNIADSSSSLNIANNRSGVTDNVFLNAASIDASLNAGEIALCHVSNAAFINAQQNTGIIEEVVLTDSSQLQASTNAGTIRNSEFFSGVIVTAFLNSGTIINNCLFSNNIALILDPAVSITGGRLEAGFSNFAATINLDTPGNLTGSTLNIPSIYNFIGVFTLTSAADHIIDSMTNFPTFSGDATFSSSVGRTYTFHNTDISIAVANQLVASSGTSDDKVVGRTNGTDIIKYRQAGNLFARTNSTILFSPATGTYITVTSGVANIYAAVSSTIVLIPNTEYRVLIDITNIGAATLQVGASAVFPILGADGVSALSAGALIGGKAYVFTFDGVNFIKAGVVYVNSDPSIGSDTLLIGTRYLTIAEAMQDVDFTQHGTIIVEASSRAYVESILAQNSTTIFLQSGVSWLNSGNHLIRYDTGLGLNFFNIEGTGDLGTTGAFDLISVSSGTNSTINLSCQSINMQGNGNIIFNGVDGSNIEVFSNDDIVTTSTTGVTVTSGLNSKFRITTPNDIIDTGGFGFISTATATDNSVLIINASKYVSTSASTSASLVRVGGYIEMNCDIIMTDLADAGHNLISANSSGAIELVINGNVKESGSFGFLNMTNGKVTFNGTVFTLAQVILQNTTRVTFNKQLTIGLLSAVNNSKLYCNGDVFADTSLLGAAPINIHDTATFVANNIYIVQQGAGVNLYALQITETPTISLNNVKLVVANTANDTIVTGFTPLVINSYGTLFGNSPMNTPGFITLNFGEAYIQDASVTNPYA